MCGRFSLTTADLDGLARQLKAELDPAFRRPWRPRFNVAPGDAHIVVRAEGGGRILREASFGFATRGGLTINARAETAARRPTFEEAWRSRRCAVPADGFYEWSGPAGARRPSWLHRADGRPLLFAALWRPSASRGTAPEFVIVTVEANADVRALHDRMPAILGEESLDAWLDGGEPRGVPEGTLSAREVSTRVNSVQNDDPACLDPPERDPQLPLL